MSLGIATGIVVLVYLIVEVLKKCVLITDKQKDMIPVIGMVLGLVLSVAVFMSGPALGVEIYVGDNLFVAILTGIASGLVATGCNQIVKKAKKLAEGNYDGLDEDLDKLLEENKDLELNKPEDKDE